MRKRFKSSDKLKDEAIKTALLARKGEQKKIAKEFGVTLDYVRYVQKHIKYEKVSDVVPETELTSASQEPIDIETEEMEVKMEDAVIEEETVKAAKKRVSLSDEQKHEILVAKGTMKISELAEMYDVAPCTISRVFANGITAKREVVKTSKEDIDKIINDARSGMKVSEIAKKYNRCAQTIYNILGKTETAIKKRENKKVAVVKEEPVAVKEDNTSTVAHNMSYIYNREHYATFIAANSILRNYVLYTKSSCISVGLVAGRHPEIDRYVTDYIFDDVQGYNIFDYEIQEKTVKDFINTHIKFSNGIPEQYIELYATGLQTVFASVIKVCSEMRINLTIKHYNSDDGKYNEQIIFDQFENLYTKGFNIPSIEHFASNNKEATLMSDLFIDPEIDLNDFSSLKCHVISIKVKGGSTPFKFLIKNVQNAQEVYWSLMNIITTNRLRNTIIWWGFVEFKFKSFNILDEYGKTVIL